MHAVDQSPSIRYGKLCVTFAACIGFGGQYQGSNELGSDGQIKLGGRDMAAQQSGFPDAGPILLAQIPRRDDEAGPPTTDTTPKSASMLHDAGAPLPAADAALPDDANMTPLRADGEIRDLKEVSSVHLVPAATDAPEPPSAASEAPGHVSAGADSVQPSDLPPSAGNADATAVAEKPPAEISTVSAAQHAGTDVTRENAAPEERTNSGFSLPESATANPETAGSSVAQADGHAIEYGEQAMLPQTALADAMQEATAWQPVSEEKLEKFRGGFDLGGLVLSFGIERAVYVDGTLVTTTSINVPDVGSLTNGQAKQLGTQAATMNLVQNGSGNAFQITPGTSSTTATYIQNTLNNQNLQTMTVINASANSLNLIKSLNSQSTLSNAINAAVSGH
jgi:hypothetical protein